MTIYIGHNLHLVQYRLRGGAVMNNVATIESSRFKRGEPNPGDPAELQEIFAQCAPRVREMLHYIARERNWVLHDRDPVTNWTKGRVTLLGDAAHPTLQYLAQGACMAIEDAVVLAAEVAAPRRGLQRRVPRLSGAAHEPDRAGWCCRRGSSATYIHAGGGARMLRNDLVAKRDPDDPWEADWLYRGIQVPE